MNRWIATLAAVGIVVAGCTDTDREPTGAAGRDDACTTALDTAFSAWERAGYSGSITISTDGAFDCRAGYGWADRATETPNRSGTVFGIGSVSKAFTAAAILALVDAGKLTLRDRAGELVTGLTGPAAQVTVRQLLLHTSGLTGSHGTDHHPLSRAEAIRAISGLERAFEPGADYAYSNAGYTLLALIIDAVADTSYRDYLVSRILTLPDHALPDHTGIGGFWDGQPAAPGPRASGYLEDGSTGERGDFAGPHWALAGNGDLAMTMPELAAWTYALFTDDLLSPAAVDVLRRPGFDHGDGTSETPGWVALDASFFGEPVLAAAGGGGDVGHDVVVAWLPDSERVIAIASNTADVSAGDLLRKLAPALVAGDLLPTPTTPDGQVDPAVAGRYETATGAAFQVSVRDNELAIAAHGVDAVRALFPPPQGMTDADVTAHEAAVLALLTGTTDQGRTEQQALRSGLDGPIEDLEPVGTVVDGGELRTYVTVSSASESMLAWYAVDEAGGVAAAMLGADPPTRSFLPTGDGGYRLDDPADTGPDVVVELDGRRLTVSGPDGTTSARRTT